MTTDKRAENIYEYILRKDIYDNGIRPLIAAQISEAVDEAEKESAKYHDDHLKDALSLCRAEAYEDAANIMESCTHEYPSSCCAIGMADDIRARAQEITK
jgi:hypothetical protein